MKKQPQAGMTRLASWVAYFYESFWEPCFDDDAAKKYDEHDLGK